MKKIGVICLVMVSILTLSGCSVQGVKDAINDAMQWVLQKDQANEQGFVITPEMIQDYLRRDDGYLDLSGIGLTAIPEICKLLNPEDLTIIQFLNLSKNKIRIIDQDLSCLGNLRVLNLNDNEISEVVRLGSLPELEELLLERNELEQADDLAQMDLPALEKLNLAYNNLKEVANLDRFKNLSVLDLQHNALQSIVGVENLEKLQELKVQFNNLTDIPFLNKLKSLESLKTEGNNLKDSLSNEVKAIEDKYTNSLYPGKAGTGE